jgi:zinc D-Ala-D-Ala carboxypeptidase
MQLSKHFKLEEFEKSQTAQRLGIKNKAGSGEIKNLTDVCYGVLEKVRVKYDKPVIVTSGYRSPALCEAIGSKATSQHTKGEAVDFEVIGIANIQVAYFIESNCDFDQLILEYYCPDDDQKGWVHCSFVEGSNRKQVLTFDGKKYTNGLPEMKWSGGKVVE